MDCSVINISKVTELTTRNGIPGLEFKQLSSQGAKQAKSVTGEGSKATKDLRKLAFDFPKQLPYKVESGGRKLIGECRGKEELGKEDPSHWCKENVDFRVRRVLMRCRTLKQARKKDRVKTYSKERVKVDKPIGKFGRGSLPHEFWEEERRLREKKEEGKACQRGEEWHWMSSRGGGAAYLWQSRRWERFEGLGF